MRKLSINSKYGALRSPLAQISVPKMRPFSRPFVQNWFRVPSQSLVIEGYVLSFWIVLHLMEISHNQRFVDP